MEHEIEEGENFTLKCNIPIPENKEWKITGKVYLNVNGTAQLTNSYWERIVVPEVNEKEGKKTE